MKRVVYFQKGIKLENDGYNNKIIQNNEILEEITDTLVGAKAYIKKNYDVNKLSSFRHIIK
nr:MAG TPA: hypothetical protein [Caudoviricetes sp.]